VNRSDTIGTGKVFVIGAAIIVMLASCGSSKASPKTNVLPTSVVKTTAVAVATTLPAPAVTPAPAPPTTVAIVVPDGFRKEPDTGQLSQGDAGPRVAALQKKLTALGGTPGPADGAFGQQTDAAVRAFQKASSLKADGIVGPQTQAAIDAACTKAKC
jgi:peptidoglycan hydrolase-like protein with peptidoglycan-binding domain